MIQVATAHHDRLAIVSYLSAQIGLDPAALIGDMPFQAAAVLRRGIPRGAVLFTNYRTHSVEVIAAGEPGWVTRDDIKAVFRFAFVELGCWQVLTLISRRNTQVRDLAKRLGLREMCVIETGPERGGDLIMSGVTRERCRWIAEPAMRAAA